MAKNSIELIKHQKENPEEWIIENVVPKNEVILISAKKNSYKTFVAVSLGLMHASREPTRTGLGVLRVMQNAGTMYLALEGKAGFGNRVQSALENDFYGDEGRYFFTDFDDSRKTQFTHVWDLADPDQGWEWQAFFLLQDGCNLLIIDTLSKAMNGNENDQATARIVVNNLYRIIREANKKYKRDMTIILVAHEGQDARSGTRGSSIFESDISTVLRIKKISDTKGKLIVSKCKTLDAEGKEYPFTTQKDHKLKTLWIDWRKDKTLKESILDALENGFSFERKDLMNDMAIDWESKYKDRRNYTTSFNNAAKSLFTDHLLCEDEYSKGKLLLNPIDTSSK